MNDKLRNELKQLVCNNLEFIFLDELQLDARGTFDQMVAAMEKWKPHILYYFGHGDVDSQGSFLVGERGLEAVNDRVDKIDGDRLVVGLSDEALQCLSLVILSACRLAKSVNVGYGWGVSAFSDIARSFFEVGRDRQSQIAAVIAMRSEIGADTAADLTRSFFIQFDTALRDNRTIEQVLIKARERVFTQGNIECLTPVLFSRSKDGLIFQIVGGGVDKAQDLFDKAKQTYMERNYEEAKELYRQLQSYSSAIQDQLR